MSTALRTYFNGPNGPVCMIDHQNNQKRYFHYDHQGTVQCLTDETGAVTDRFASDAWGVQVKRTGTSINRQWYIGRSGYYRQVDQALDYVRARYLQPAVGRWLTQDPAEDYRAAGYVYVLNNPPAGTDPTGLVSIVGAASCDDTPVTKVRVDTWCGRPDRRTYETVWCNQRVDLKACPIYRVGKTAAFPNIILNAYKYLEEDCGTCPPTTAKSRCNVFKSKYVQPKLGLVANCGETLRVIKGKCYVDVMIIDVGPSRGLKSGAIIDLHPQAAAELYYCLTSKPFPGCVGFGIIPQVTVSDLRYHF
jgi:RHS repeat-associated protein